MLTTATAKLYRSLLIQTAPEVCLYDVHERDKPAKLAQFTSNLVNEVDRKRARLQPPSQPDLAITTLDPPGNSN